MLSAAQIDQTIRNWLTCDECWNRQLQHVVMMEEQSLGRLSEYFLDPEELESDASLTLRYGAVYDALYAAHPSEDEPKGDFVNRYKEQFRRRVEIRTATAIVMIKATELPVKPGWPPGSFTRSMLIVGP